MTHRSASTCWRPGNVVCPQRSPGNCSPAPRPAPHAAGRESGSFSCSTPPSFVLSHNMPMVNTTSNWLRFGAFLSPPVPPLRIHWPLSYRFTLHAPRFTLLPATDRRIAKDRMGPIWPSGPSILLCAEPGGSCGKSNPFPLTRCRPPTEHSLVAGGTRRHRLQACLPDGHTAQCPFSAYPP
jgi:hypothetical protein